MKIFIYAAVLLGAFDLNPIKISKVNKARATAEKAFESKKYSEAIAAYSLLADTLRVTNPETHLNLAHCYYQLKKTDQAVNFYQKAASSADKHVASVAKLQLGNIYAKEGEKEKALEQFKDALKDNPANIEARKNYEMLKKLPDKKMPPKQEEKEQKKEDKNEQENKKESPSKGDEKKGSKKDKQGNSKDEKESDNGQSKNKSDKNGEKKENDSPNNEKGKEQSDKNSKPDDKGKKEGKSEKESDGPNASKKLKQKPVDENKGKKESKEGEQTVVNKEKLEKMNLTEQQAKMILNAMKNNEVQYLQQRQKNSAKSRENAKGKPDW